MTADIDMEKLKEICPELADAIDNISGYDAIVLSCTEWKSIAARMLALAQENEKMRILIGRIANGIYQEPEFMAREFLMPEKATQRRRR